MLGRRTWCTAALAVTVLAGGCGGGSKSSSTRSAGSTAAVQPGTSPQSADQLRQRLVAAGLQATELSGGPEGVVAQVSVPAPSATMVVVFFQTRAGAEAYVQTLVGGVAAGRGLIQLVSNHVYAIAVDSGMVTAAQRQLFNRVVVTGEAR